MLEPDKGYNLVLYSRNGSYVTFGLLKGSRYDFSAETHFADGWAQYSTDGGSNWQNYIYVLPTRDVDLQFSFVLANDLDSLSEKRKFSVLAPKKLSVPTPSPVVSE